MRQIVVAALPLGVLAAVNPCAFPLLPAYLALFTRGASGAARTRAALTNGAAMTAGFVGLFAVVGAAASVLLGPLLAVVPGIAAALGVLLVVLGAAEAAGRSLRLPLPSVPFAGGAGPIAAAGFGVAYGVASLGCALPLFAAAAAQGAAAAGVEGTLTAAVAYAFGMGVLVTGIGVALARLGIASGRRMTRLGRITSLLQGGVVVVCGICLLLLGLRDAGLPAPAALGDVQSALAEGLGAAPAVAAAIAAVVVIAGLAGLAVGDLRKRAAAR